MEYWILLHRMFRIQMWKMFRVTWQLYFASPSVQRSRCARCSRFPSNSILLNRMFRFQHLLHVHGSTIYTFTVPQFTFSTCSLWSSKYFEQTWMFSKVETWILPLSNLYVIEYPPPMVPGSAQDELCSALASLNAAACQFKKYEELQRITRNYKKIIKLLRRFKSF